MIYPYLKCPDSEGDIHIKAKYKEKLMQAYVKLNSWEWDDVIGEKPAGFDEMEQSYRRRKWYQRKRKNIKYKMDYISPKMKFIRRVIGDDMCSWAWWKYKLERSYEEWVNWYYTDRFKDDWIK